jgi:hypothetical protein
MGLYEGFRGNPSTFSDPLGLDWRQNVPGWVKYAARIAWPILLANPLTNPFSNYSVYAMGERAVKHVQETPPQQLMKEAIQAGTTNPILYSYYTATELGERYQYYRARGENNPAYAVTLTAAELVGITRVAEGGIELYTGETPLYQALDKIEMGILQGVLTYAMVKYAVCPPKTAPAVALKRASTKLYRAVSEAEYQQLMKTGQFEAGPNSLEGKFFAENPADAAKWGNSLEGSGKFRVVEVEVPTSVAEKFMRWEKLDNIGPARYAELDKLSNVNIRKVK